MLNLFKSEWSRIKKLTWLVGLVHSVVLLFMLNFGLLFSTSVGFKITWVLFYGCYGFLLAVLQMRLYKETSQWVYLLNRPVSTKHVFMGLFLAVLLSLLVSVVLPVALVTVAVDALGTHQIDWRHYTQLSYLLGVAVSFYLTGVFLTLLRNRWFALLMILPILPLMSLNLGGRVMVLQLAVLLVLLVVVLLFFKMNLQQRPQGKGGVLFLAVVLQWCVFTTSVAVFDVVQLTVAEVAYLNNQDTATGFEQHPKQFRKVSYLDSKQKILTALSEANTAPARQYMEQSALNEAFRIRKRVWFHPTQQQIQLMDERGLVIQDEVNHQQWTFSHDDMLFVGRDLQTLESVGYMGPTKQAQQLSAFEVAERFSGVPWIAGHQFIVGHQLYRYDQAAAGIELVFVGQPGELLLNVLQPQGEISTLISNQQLYVFDSIEVRKQQWPLAAALVMPLPGDYNNLWDVSVMQVKDNFLLSFLYGKDPRKAAYPAEQRTHRIQLDGDSELLAVRPLEHDQGVLMRYVNYLVSPFWTVVNDRLPVLPARDRYLQQRPWPLPIPSGVVMAMVVMTLLVVLLTVHWSSQLNLNAVQKLLWTLSNGITGVPGLVALRLLHKPTEQVPAQLQTKPQLPASTSMEANHA